MDSRITSKGESVCSCRSGDENKNSLIFLWFYAFGYGYSLWAEQSLDAVRIYPSEQADLVLGSPKQHEWTEKPEFYGNMQIRERYHAVKDVPGYGKISLKQLLCGRGYKFGSRTSKY